MYVGKTDVFERTYRGKFSKFVAGFGEVVNYERDRGARDIGIHLTRKKLSGSEVMSSSICWFQLKGIQASTLSKEDFESAPALQIRLKVKDLRFWYLQGTPTYLSVYVESLDKFFYVNIQKYVEENWGAGILQQRQQTLQVSIPKDEAYHLDEVAFYHLLKDNDVKRWAQVFATDEGKTRLFLRDYNLINLVATAEERKVSQRLYIFDWESKLRTEVYLEEKAEGADEWQRVHTHWELLLLTENIESTFPYLRLSPGEEQEEWDDSSEDEEYCPTLNLSGGTVRGEVLVYGEAVEYTLSVELNDLGRQMYEWLRIMADVGVLEMNTASHAHISVAPWNRRDV